MKLLKPKDDAEFIKVQADRHTSLAHEYPLSPWQDDIFNEFKEYLSGPVIDIGTRNGKLLDKFEEEGITPAFGVEITDIAKYAQETMKRNVIQCDIQKKIPFPDKFFKSAVMTHVLEHCYDPDSALKEIKRILDGYILFIIPVGESDISYGHYTVFENIEDAIILVEKNGFEVINSYSKGWAVNCIICKTNK